MTGERRTGRLSPFRILSGMESPRKTTSSRLGFTLVEVLVVLAIVAILGALALPAARTFFQGEQERGARELYSLIRAARVYAATYRVNTAVVYDVADNVPDTLILQDPNNPTGNTVQVLRGAMMVYELPASRDQYAGYHVPVPGWEGFQPFMRGYCVLLQAPPNHFSAPPESEVGFYAYRDPNPDDNIDDLKLLYNLPTRLGLRNEVDVIIDPVIIGGNADLSVFSTQPREDQYDTFPGHCFDPTGKLLPPDGSSGEQMERYRIFFAPMPDRPLSERITSLRADADPDNPAQVSLWLQGGLSDAFTMIGVPIEIYRSTGRVEMGKL